MQHLVLYRHTALRTLLAHSTYCCIGMQHLVLCWHTALSTVLVCNT